MAPSKRELQQIAEETSSPPGSLPEGQLIASVVKAVGNNLFMVSLPGQRAGLVELAPRFRSSVWLRRGGFVVVDLKAFEHRDNKLEGEIVNVVQNEKEWRKQSYWPERFPRKAGPGKPAEEAVEDDDEA